MITVRVRECAVTSRNSVEYGYKSAPAMREHPRGCRTPMRAVNDISKRSPIPPGCLDYDALTARLGWESVQVTRVMNNRAKRRRAEGKSRPGDMPAPDGYVGQRPYWREETIAAWETTRPYTIADARNHRDGTKTCSNCNQRKSVDEFQATRDRKGNPTFTSNCRSCRGENTRAWNLSNRERHSENNKRYIRTEHGRRRRKATQYGIEWWELAALEAAQQGICSICGDTPEKGLVVDHCHETGVVRGLLCSLCNIGIGHFRDNPRLLLGAIIYLKERSSGVFDRRGAAGPDGLHPDSPAEPAAG